MEKAKATSEKGIMRSRWRQCIKHPTEQSEHKVLPKIYHETLLPGYYTDGEYVCDECLHVDLGRYQRLVDLIDRELQRRDQVYRQAGF